MPSLTRSLYRSLERSLHRVAREIASESQSKSKSKSKSKIATDTFAARVRVGLWLMAVLTKSKIVEYLHANAGAPEALGPGCCA